MNRNRASASDLRAHHTQMYNNARYSLLITLVLTFINVLMAAFGEESYYVSSFALPYSLVFDASFYTGRLPEDWYTPDIWPDSMPFYDIGYLYVMLAVAAVILLIYLACFIFSRKNRTGWLIAALVLMILDTGYMFLVYNIGNSIILDIIVHGFLIYSLSVGVYNGIKLKKLPLPEEAPQVPVTEDNTEIPLPSEENK